MLATIPNGQYVRMRTRGCSGFSTSGGIGDHPLASPRALPPLEAIAESCPCLLAGLFPALRGSSRLPVVDV